jgi:hypothetical protein
MAVKEKGVPGRLEKQERNGEEGREREDGQTSCAVFGGDKRGGDREALCRDKLCIGICRLNMICVRKCKSSVN